MKIEDFIKDKILDWTAQYYKTHHKQNDSKKINYAGRVFDEKELVSLVNSSLEFWLTSGKYCSKFEKQLKVFLNIRHVALVNSGSSANLLAFMALTSPLLKERKIDRGEEVITTACCFPTTIAPIIQYGAVPVFVDIDLNTLNINIEEMKKALSLKTRAVMIAHTLGNSFNIKEVKKFCDDNKLWLIEDNCDALGSVYKNKFTGTFGDIGTSSFYPPHHITCGEGGAVYTNNDLLHKIILSMRDWGRDCNCKSGQDNRCGNRFNKQFGTLPFGFDHKYVYSHFGYNLKMTDLQAAIGVEQIKKLPEFINTRMQNFEYLKKELKDLEKYVIFIDKEEESFPSWFGFPITLKPECLLNRNEITSYLEENRIQTRNVFAGNILNQPCFDYLQEDVDYRSIGNLKNTNKIMNDTFWIGVYPGLNKHDLSYIVLKLKELFI